jgi:hypothetical protein
MYISNFRSKHNVNVVKNLTFFIKVFTSTIVCSPHKEDKRCYLSTTTILSLMNVSVILKNIMDKIVPSSFK